MPRPKSAVKSALCLHQCDPALRDALLLVLDSLTTRAPPVAAIVGLQTYAGLVRNFEPTDIFHGVRVSNQLDSLVPGFSSLSETGLLLALAYILRGRNLAEAVKQAAFQSGTPLSMPIRVQVVDDLPVEPVVDVDLLIDQRAAEHGLSRAEYLRFSQSGILAD